MTQVYSLHRDNHSAVIAHCYCFLDGIYTYVFTIHWVGNKIEQVMNGQPQIIDVSF